MEINPATTQPEPLFTSGSYSQSHLDFFLASTTAEESYLI